MLRNVSNRKLLEIAAYGAVFVIGSCIYMQYSYKQRIKSQEFYKKALAELRNHPSAVSLMGEPIKERGFDLTDAAKNKCNDTFAQFEVKVKGPKDKGLLYFWADKPKDEWIINRLELEVDSVPDKRLKIIDLNKVHSK